MSQSSIKVAVADTQIIVRMGVVAALKRVLGASVSCLEIANPDDFETKVISFSPNVIVVSPYFGGKFEVRQRRSAIADYARDVSFVALVSCATPVSALDDFDSQISVADAEDDIMWALRSLGVLDDGDDGESLSSREKQVLRGIVKGMTNKEIAEELNISIYTVLTHRRNIAKKLNIHSSIALAIYAISNKIVTVDEVNG